MEQLLDIWPDDVDIGCVAVNSLLRGCVHHKIKQQCLSFFTGANQQIRKNDKLQARVGR